MPPADSVPEELREPFYTDQYEQEHIKPPVVRLLLSAELYCRAGSLILRSDAAKPLLGHDAVIQALAQKGLYVTDQERLVTERDLHKKPIQMVSLRGRRAGGPGAGGAGNGASRCSAISARSSEPLFSDASSPNWGVWCRSNTWEKQFSKSQLR